MSCRKGNRGWLRPDAAEQHHKSEEAMEEASQLKHLYPW
jgi:hypothetical protein